MMSLGVLATAALLILLPASPALGAPGTEYLYVAGAASDRLLGYRVGADGAPRLVADVPTGFGNLSVKESADHRFLYVLTITPAAAIFAYEIGAGGDLSPVPGTPTVLSEPPLGMNLSPDGKHLVLLTGPSLDGGAHLQGYSVAANGAPTPQGVPVAIGPAGIAGGPVPMPVVSPDSLNVYVSNYSGGTMTRFELRSDSTVSAARESVRTGGGPVSPTFSPDGQFVYTSNEHTSSVSAFRYQPTTGALVEVPGSPFPATGLTPHGIGLSPDGRFLYTPNALTDDVTGFAVQPDGALRPLPGSPFPGGPVGTMPGQVFVSSDGQRLYAVDLAGTSPTPTVALRGYRIEPDGALTPDAGEAVGTGLLFSAASLLVAGR
ncbi:lactonase family protein [Nocardia sp. NPDC056952]|uniref:lactonase family protein n=1 Tax=Nocardia sp. NPDC056952 TaxID=3345979 RepID=UPI0036432DE4